MAASRPPAAWGLAILRWPVGNPFGCLSHPPLQTPPRAGEPPLRGSRPAYRPRTRTLTPPRPGSFIRVTCMYPELRSCYFDQGFSWMGRDPAVASTAPGSALRAVGKGQVDSARRGGAGSGGEQVKAIAADQAG